MLTREDFQKLVVEKNVPESFVECLDLLDEYSYRIFDDLEQLHRAEIETDPEELRKKVAGVAVYLDSHLSMLNLAIEGVSRVQNRLERGEDD